MSLDHLVYAVPDLEEGVAVFAERTGVRPMKGGSHPGGTANYLVGLGPTAYLEIIGPDPEVEGARPRALGLETLTEARLAAWAIRPEDLDATVARARERGYDPGEVQPLSRRTPDGTLLEWRLTRWDNPAAIRPVPFLIDWGTTRHPAASGLPQLTLAAFSAVTPDVAAVRADLDAVGAELDVEEGPEVRLRAVLDTPKGKVELA
ncbi:VOC family protein [Nonomuraea africana]|uniref:Catechol 2,3-dioxygenase-like lactoylglutathione lyase family enzyme n=1 Tax=Nonomuraea africana TaxID=46171 RepID=A0ABR9K6S7_9ACTN|nr:VOC family protein [Nonomuraea africana]MBE1557721.1 catechol 2,3-dioxygenase-like lactoylglutathione lyase family enzyme [Nonomuraea africana]